MICLHQDWKQSFRNANISIAVGSAILVGGVLIFRHSGEAALQGVAIVGFIAALVVFNVLDERTKRRKTKRSQ